jgi:hypothetical protein
VSAHPHTRNFFNSTGNSDDVKGDGTELLKIGIDRQFIRYFIEANGAIIFYGDYALQGVADTDELAEQLANIMAKDTFLSKSYAAVKVCWHTDFEIIPVVFFDEAEMAAQTAYTPVMDGEANFIFELPEAPAGLIKNKYGAVVHTHSGAALIEQLRKEGLATADKLFINIHADNIEIACFGPDGRLRIYNRYDYRAYQDYIYFVLLVADEMKINREEARAMLMGEVSRESQLYDITYRYFMHTAFIVQPEAISFSRAFEEYPRHLNYPLYNL